MDVVTASCGHCLGLFRHVARGAGRVLGNAGGCKVRPFDSKELASGFSMKSFQLHPVLFGRCPDFAAIQKNGEDEAFVETEFGLDA